VSNVPAGNKLVLYLALNVTCCLAIIIGAAVEGGSLAELPYVAMLFALCTSPILFFSRVNDKFAMLGIVMASYFLLFGMSDLVSSFSVVTMTSAFRGLSDTEIVILIGAAMLLAGFHAAVALVASNRPGAIPDDWPASLLVPIGLLLWIAGNGGALYQSLVAFDGQSDAAIASGLARLGSWPALLMFFLSNYAGPLGVIILAYWWSTRKPRGGTLVMLLLILAQIIVGWVVDRKEVALAAPVAVILTRTFCVGRLPVRWIIGSLIGLALIFPVMTTKRMILTEDLGLTVKASLPRTVELFWRSLKEMSGAKAGKYGDGPITFIERSSLKPSVDLLVRNVGKSQDHPYKLGATLDPMVSTFFPRIFWTDTRPANSAETFNREFQISESADTHISMSHLGEWYWNFGLTGIIFGMAAVGAVCGVVAVKCDLSTGTSLTRVLIIYITFYELAVLGEGQMSVQYVVWARSLVLIGVLHAILAKPRGGGLATAEGHQAAAPGLGESPAAPAFRNVMR
jgi:hypothetical protein